MFQKNVTKSDHQRPRGANRRKDKRKFSRTADNSKSVNRPSGRPMRGGIRL